MDKTAQTWQDSPVKGLFSKSSASVPVSLHLGAHKTATTTIQREFETRRRELMKLGVAYLGPNDLRGVDGLRFPNPEKVASGQAKPIQSRTAKRLPRLASDMMRDSTKRLLVSEENILGASRINLRHAVLYPDLDERLKALPEAWNKEATEVFLSIRSYERFFASCQSTVAVQGTWMDLDVEALAQLPRRWPDVIADIKTRFPKALLTVWRFEELRDIGQLAVDEMVGAAFPIDFTSKSSMTSLTQDGMEALREEYSASGKPVSREKVQEIRQATEAGGKYNPWPDELRESMDAAYSKDWGMIASLPGVRAL